MFKRGVYILGGMGGFRECPTVAYGCLKEGIFWEGGVDYWSVAYSGEEGGYNLEGGLYSGRDAYLYKGGGGIFWEGGVDSGRVG